ncbi:MAG: hypothetical protein K8F90_14155 [Hyphomicrobiales bacterium]|nr:hypothetical protein [Hyphomicrobiales bacterium]
MATAKLFERTRKSGAGQVVWRVRKAIMAEGANLGTNSSRVKLRWCRRSGEQLSDHFSAAFERHRFKQGYHCAARLLAPPSSLVPAGF